MHYTIANPMIVTQDIKPAVKILRDGRLVAFPTGTAYGLAADALQGFALQRLRLVKHRPADKTFTLFMHQALWKQYLDLTDQETNLLSKAQNQPLTLLVKPTAALAHLRQAGRIGLRVIDHPLMHALSEAIETPLTATSANKSDEPPCYDVACLQTTFSGKIDETTYDLSVGCIIDGGTLPSKTVSTIARLDADQITIIRPGALSKEDLQTLLLA
jgi:L-threonylcarbamoyladenylate synthase